MASDNHTSAGVGSGMPASPPRDNLYRATSDITVERAADGAGMATLTGHFAVWDVWAEIRSTVEGHFLERFAPGSMTKTLSERTPKVLFQHGRDPQIGDKPLGPVARAEPDDTGAFYEVPLLDTAYNRDLLPGLEAGLYGASHRFSVVHEDVVRKPARSEHNPNGIMERTVQEARVMEFGPVTFPAYAQATAGVRSLTDEFRLPIPGYGQSQTSFTDVGTPEFWMRLGNGTTTNSTATYENYDFAATSAEHRATEPPPDEAEVHAEPEPDATTPDGEPEPTEATTRSDSRGLFWFADDPKLKGAKK